MSPKLTPQELQEARQRKQEERAEMRRQAEEEAEMQQRENEEERREEEIRERYDILRTVSDSLYEELDKLTKKAPKETLTNLSLEKVNELIRDTKDFLDDDSYLKNIHAFEPAGDNPEYRDALLIVGQLRAALKRFRSGHHYGWSEFQ